MGLPKEIKMGPHTYTVISQEAPEKEAVGWHNFTELRIYIASAGPMSVQEETLLHEMLHAASVFVGLGRDQEKEYTNEEWVNAISPTFYMMLKDNGLFDFSEKP